MNKMYIGYADFESTPNAPKLLVSTIDTDYENCLFRTAWELEARGQISEDEAERMETNLAQQLGIHIMEMDMNVAAAIGRAADTKIEPKVIK